jgi:hypothetical protein
VGRGVPVGEEERHKETGIEEDVEGEPPGDKVDGHNGMDDALALGLIRLISQLEPPRLQTMVFRSILLLHLLIIISKIYENNVKLFFSETSRRIWWEIRD